jgi:hypothetical protein
MKDSLVNYREQNTAFLLYDNFLPVVTFAFPHPPGAEATQARKCLRLLFLES